MVTLKGITLNTSRRNCSLHMNNKRFKRLKLVHQVTAEVSFQKHVKAIGLRKLSELPKSHLSCTQLCANKTCILMQKLKELKKVQGTSTSSVEQPELPSWHCDQGRIPWEILIRDLKHGTPKNQTAASTALRRNQNLTKRANDGEIIEKVPGEKESDDRARDLCRLTGT
ncbi:hypothetical protein LXL04_024244 [Taraxacum kok-saghyz]